MVATSTDLKSLVEAVGGDRVTVEALVAPGQDPHTVEVKPGQMAALRRAALLVRIGLDHEPWLARALRTAREPGSMPADLDCSRGIALLQAETRAREVRAGRARAWLRQHALLARSRERAAHHRGHARGAGAAVPTERGYFTQRRADFLTRLDAGLARWQSLMAPYRGAKVVVVHESWPYFAQRFGLDIVAAIEPTPGVPPSPAYLASLTRRMKEAQVAWSSPSPIRAPRWWPGGGPQRRARGPARVVGGGGAGSP